MNFRQIRATALDAVLAQLGRGDDQISVNSLAAAVLEESPGLTMQEIYLEVAFLMQKGHAELHEDPETAVVYVRARVPDARHRPASWTLENDPAAMRAATAVEEIVDAALTGAEAGEFATRVSQLMQEPLAAAMSDALAAARGRALDAYRFEHADSALRLAELTRRRRLNSRDPRVSNPAPSRRFTQ